MRKIELDDRETEVLRRSAYFMAEDLLTALDHAGVDCVAREEAELILKVAGLTAFDLAVALFIRRNCD